MSARKARAGGEAHADALRRVAATATITSGAAGTVAGSAHRALGAHLVVAEATDDATIDDGLDLMHSSRLDLAAAPAASLDDVMVKLASLTKGLLAAGGEALEHERADLALATGALADLVLLRARPADCAPAPRTPAEHVEAIRQAERRAGR